VTKKGALQERDLFGRLFQFGLQIREGDLLFVAHALDVRQLLPQLGILTLQFHDEFVAVVDILRQLVTS
jgi:hypothetical protein